jgi:hypothetical protein
VLLSWFILSYYYCFPMYPKSLEPISLPKDLDPCMFPSVARTMSVARQRNKIILHPVQRFLQSLDILLLVGVGYHKFF